MFMLVIIAGCNQSSDPIETIHDEMHYIEKDGDREYVITFLEGGRADVAWYGRQDIPESITYEISEEPVEVENEEPMKSIRFDNFPSREKYSLNNSNDSTFLIDDSEETLVLRDYKYNSKSKTITLTKDLDSDFIKQTEENDIFLVKVEND